MMNYFNQDAFISLLKRLATEKGPSLFEEPRRKVLENFLTESGVEFNVDTAGNLWISFGKGTWEETVIFDAHIDVVQKGYASEVKYDGENLIGMGVADNLTAVAMLAFLSQMISEQKPDLKRPLKILFSVGEEGDGNLKGVRKAVQDHPESPFLFISFDLSYKEYSLTALGAKRYKVTADGQGGHSWGDYGIPNAIAVLNDFFGELKKEFKLIESDHIGNVSFNIGSIQGGEGINSIAKSSEATYEFRSVDFQLLEKLDDISNRIIDNLNTDETIKIQLTLTSERPAARAVQPERIEPLIRKLLLSVCENPESVPRSTNINIPLAYGWPSVCMGLCRSGRYHSEEEYVEIDSLNDGWTLLCNLCDELVVKN